MGAMKRPSDVPPVVDNCASIPTCCFIDFCQASTNKPLGVRKGSPKVVQFAWYLTPSLSNSLVTIASIPSAVISVEYLRLNVISTVSGMTSVSYTHLTLPTILLV